MPTMLERVEQIEEAKSNNWSYEPYPRILAFAQAVAAVINSLPDAHPVKLPVEIKEQEENGYVEFVSKNDMVAPLYINPDEDSELETALTYTTAAGVEGTVSIQIECWNVNEPADVDYAAKAVLEIMYIQY